MITSAYLDKPRLAQFIFPGYRVVKGFATIARHKKIMYFLREGRDTARVMKALEINAEESVLVHLQPVVSLDYELTDPLAYCQALAKNRKIRYAKNLEKKVPVLSPSDFDTFIKYSSLLKRWYREIFKEGEKAYQLFEALSESKVAFIGKYFEIRKTMSAPEALSALLTFMIKFKSREGNRDQLSEYYQRVMVKVRGQMKRMPQAIQGLVSSPNEIPLDLRTIQFLLSLRGGR